MAYYQTSRGYWTTGNGSSYSTAAAAQSAANRHASYSSRGGQDRSTVSSSSSAYCGITASKFSQTKHNTEATPPPVFCNYNTVSYCEICKYQTSYCSCFKCRHGCGYQTASSDDQSYHEAGCSRRPAPQPVLTQPTPPPPATIFFDPVSVYTPVVKTYRCVCCESDPLFGGSCCRKDDFNWEQLPGHMRPSRCGGSCIIL